MEKIALLFSGLGSQYIGMGKNMCSDFEIARRTFEEASDILGFDIKELCLSRSLSELSMPENLQPTLLTVSVACFRVYMEEIGIPADFYAGHSLGEYSALTCGGYIDFQDALRITRQRGIFMKAVSGMMTVIDSIKNSVVDEVCRRINNEANIVGIACYNSDEQVLISGNEEGVFGIEDELMEMGAKVTPVMDNSPAHSPLMKEAAAKLKHELVRYTFNDGVCKVLSNVYGIPYEGKHKIVDYLTLQMTNPVKWQTVINYLENEGVTLAVEIGPKTVLRDLVRSNTPNIKAFSYDKKDDVKALKKVLNINRDKNKEVHKKDIDKRYFISRCLAIAVCTKNYNPDLHDYQEGVVKPYKEVKYKLVDMEKSTCQPKDEELMEALCMLKSVLKTKGVPIDEQKRRLNKLLDETGTRDFFEECILDVS